MSEDFILAPGEEFIQCPYNPSHLITDSRLMFHLDKCRSSYVSELSKLSPSERSERMEECKYNWSHQVPKIELALHLKYCPSRFNPAIRPENPAELMMASPPPKPVELTTVTGEDWEAEAQGCESGYDPSQKLESTICSVVPKGLTKSQRKAYTRDLRKRAAETEEGRWPLQQPTNPGESLSVFGQTGKSYVDSAQGKWTAPQLLLASSSNQPTPSTSTGQSSSTGFSNAWNKPCGILKQDVSSKMGSMSLQDDDEEEDDDWSSLGAAASPLACTSFGYEKSFRTPQPSTSDESWKLTLWNTVEGTDSCKGLFEKWNDGNDYEDDDYPGVDPYLRGFQ